MIGIQNHTTLEAIACIPDVVWSVSWPDTASVVSARISSWSCKALSSNC